MPEHHRFAAAPAARPSAGRCRRAIALAAGALLAACADAEEDYFVGGQGLFPPPFCDFTVSFPGRPEFALVRMGDDRYAQATVRTSVFMTRAECAPRQPSELTAAMLAPGYAEQYDDATITPVADAPGPAVRVSGSLSTSFGRVRDEYLIVEGPQSILVLQTAGTEPRYPTREVRNFLASLRPVGAPPPERLYEFPVAERDERPSAPPPAPAAPAAAAPASEAPASEAPADEPAPDAPADQADAPEVPTEAPEVQAEAPEVQAGAPEALPPLTLDVPAIELDRVLSASGAAAGNGGMRWRPVAGRSAEACRLSGRRDGAAFDSLHLDRAGIEVMGDGQRRSGGLQGAVAVVIATGDGLARLDLTPDGRAVGDAETAFRVRQALAAGRALTVRILRSSGPEVMTVDPAGFVEALDAAGCPPLG